MCATLVLQSMLPIDLLAKVSQEAFYLYKGHFRVNEEQEAIGKEARGRLVDKWHGEPAGRWTHRFIPEVLT